MHVVPAITAWFRRLAIAGLLILGSMAAAVADEARDRAALDRLFAELKAAPDAATAQQIGQRIWIYWTTPSDPLLSARMGELLAARRQGELRRAIALADGLIGDYPEYAEAWNQRATLHYLLGDLDASLADCDEVLAREPRHFGALSGRSLIYLQQGKRSLALKDMAAALKIHPFLAERQLFPELQQEITRI
jgi:tetratricopeptide (TPR) repeat protein